MASKRRKRKSSPRSGTGGTRRRPARAVNWGLWLWAIALANVGGGLLFSPVTAPKKISLVGVEGRHKAHIEAVLGEYGETPWLRLNVQEIEVRLAEPDPVRRAKFEPNVFGRATVTFVYRDAVAKLDGLDDIYLDVGGDLYRDEQVSDVPMVKVEPSYLDVSATVLGHWPRAGVIETVSLMAESLPQLDYSLELDARSVLSLNITDGPTVVLGSPRELGKKIETLSAIFSQEGVALTSRTTLNLMAPERPTILSN